MAAAGPFVLEGFAGPGGWGEGLRMAAPGAHAFGVEWDQDACATGAAAGHLRVQADVAAFPLDHLPSPDLLVMSPPCQPWSRSGKRLAAKDLRAVVAHAQRVMATGRWEPYQGHGPLAGRWHDDRSPLVLEVVRWVLATRPVAVALEQVEDVAPFWRLVARWLDGLGYSTWTGVLSAERYGVPQTRRRAILVASQARRMHCPAPTHTAYDPRLPDGGRWSGTQADLFGEALQPWISMADALFWGLPDRPAPTVTAGGTDTGGVEVFSNYAMRQRIAATWEVTTRANRQTPGGNRFTADRPSWAITEKTRSWTVAPVAMGDVRASRGTVRGLDEPAALQSFPAGYPWHGSRTAQHRQVGDAVPPLLARAVCAVALGVEAGGAAHVA